MSGERQIDPGEYRAVKQVLETYCQEGSRLQDMPALKAIFHEAAVMNGVGKEGRVFGPIQNLFDLWEQVGPAEDCEHHTDVLDIAGETAVGRCVIKNWHGKDFVDFHELIKVDGKWQIIAKTYQEF